MYISAILLQFALVVESDAFATSAKRRNRDDPHDIDPIRDLQGITPSISMDPAMDPERAVFTLSEEPDKPWSEEQHKCTCLVNALSHCPGCRTDNKTITVLSLGDSLASEGLGYSLCLQRDLKKYGIELVQYGSVAQPNSGRCGSSFGIGLCARDFLTGGDSQYSGFSVVSFNTGLHDVSDFYGRESREDYQRNLGKLLLGLRNSLSPDTKLVFQLTTPAPPGNGMARNDTDIVGINDVAKSLLTSIPQPIAVSDLHGGMVDYCRQRDESRNYPESVQCPSLQMDKNVHLVQGGCELLGRLVANSILTQLGLPLLDTSRWNLNYDAYIFR